MAISYPFYKEASYDMFGRLAVAGPHKLFEFSATCDFDTTRYLATKVVGAGTVSRDAQKTQIELYTSTASGDKAIIKSRRAIQYNKANSQEIFVIYRPNPIANRRERWGYFDDNNGVFFEHDGTSARCVVRSDTSGSIVDTPFEQADWDDPLDGTGPSGKTVDWTKQSVFKIEFGWLSSRGVRFTIDVQGTLVPVKTWLISNTLLVPFMRTPQLPIRFEVENTGVVASATTSSFSCCAVQSSGSSQQEGPIRAMDTGVSTIAVSTTEKIAAGIRLKSTFQNGSVSPADFTMLPSSGNDFLFYQVIYNPTLVGDVWSTPSSGIVDKLTSATSYTGGSVLSSGHLPLGNKNQVGSSILRDIMNDIYLGSDLNGNSDSLIITFKTNAGTSTVFFSGQYREFC